MIVFYQKLWYGVEVINKFQVEFQWIENMQNFKIRVIIDYVCEIEIYIYFLRLFLLVRKFSDNFNLVRMIYLIVLRQKIELINIYFYDVYDRNGIFLIQYF